MSEGFRGYQRRPDLPVFEPPWTHGPAPKQVNSTRRIHNVLHVAGIGPRPAKVMFIMPGLVEDDARDGVATTHGFHVQQDPRYMKSQAGMLFKNLLEECQLPVQQQYITAVCKWLLPKVRRSKPSAADMEWADAALENEIREVKPEIIVCLGKPVFDHLFGMKLKLSEIDGGWFYSAKYKCRLFPMEDHQRALFKPELVEKFRVDLIEVKRMLDLLNGVVVDEIEQNYEIIRNSTELQAWVCRMQTENRTLFSVDAEWGGKHHVDGQLRSIQFCWAPGCAVYLMFRDETKHYVFDVPYAEVGRILAPLLNRPCVKYIGHQLVADLVWMQTWLGLDIYQKGIWDTSYAMQCIDENQGQGLERISLAYTTLGRYDIKLIVERKALKLEDDEGYERIRDLTLIPYACCDVDVVMRAYPQQMRQMAAQGPRLLNYFVNQFLPFVTDVFSEFTLCGLPADMQRMDRLREVFLLARDKMNRNFRIKIVEEAKQKLLMRLCKIDVAGGIACYHAIEKAMQMPEGPETALAAEIFDKFVPEARRAEVAPFFDHYLDAPGFNIRSPLHMPRWLFTIKGFTPIKSTNNKEKGLPSVAWERVLRLPLHAQKDFRPSADKQTLKVLSEKDALVMELLQLNAVGNLTKAFLRPAEVDEDGKLVRENGLHYWVATDGRIHGQFATTETGRPRSWKPNSLNWPSWTNKQVADGILQLVEAEPEGSEFRQAFTRLTGDARDAEGKLKPPPSIRSCISAQAVEHTSEEDQWCFVESDYQTAEVRGLAFMSGDENLIRLITEEDKQFGALKGIGFAADGSCDKDKIKLVRLCYSPDYGIAINEQNPEFLYAIVKDGKITKRVAKEDLQHKPDGTLWHPVHDLHWNLAEFTLHKPREVLHKKRHRDGLGKTGNFKSTYGSSGEAMERAIEAETGSKPDARTGDAILKALAERQPVADAWLKALELVPDNEGVWQAQSGRVRHFRNHDRNAPVGQRIREKILSSLAREARNFPMQTSVADTSAKAGLNLIHFYRTHGMKARVAAILYDSVVTLCPIKERFAVRELHQLFMTDLNKWKDHGRVWDYPADHEFNFRWSQRPNAEEIALLDSPEWHVDAALNAKVLNEIQIIRNAGSYRRAA